MPVAPQGQRELIWGGVGVILLSLITSANARSWQPLNVAPNSSDSRAAGTSWIRRTLPGPAPTFTLLPAGQPASAMSSPQSESSPTARPGVAVDVPEAAVVPAEVFESAPGRAPGPTPLLTPFLSGGLPTGYTGSWGDYSISGSAGTAGRQRGGVPDGSVNLGLSLGDPLRAVGVDVYWGIGSIQRFGGNGGVGGSIGRVLVSQPRLQVAVAGGVIDAYTYGFEEDIDNPTTGYGAITATIPLQPNNRDFPRLLQITAGGGGKLFAPLDQNFQPRANGSAFGAIGMELTRNIGASVGISGRATNVGISLIPIRDIPVFVNLLAADVFNSTPYGTIGVLSVGWGDNFRRGFFAN